MMKWSELKKRIDDKIEAQNWGNEPLDPEIDYIDIGHYFEEDDVELVLIHGVWHLQVA